MNDTPIYSEERKIEKGVQEEKEIKVHPPKPNKEIDTFLRILLYVFSFLMGPLGLGVILGAIFFVQREKECREVGRVCLILAIVPSFLFISLVFLFVSLAFLVAIGGFFFY